MFFNKKTKIIATIGPASQKEEVLEKMIINGVDCMRLNFSHGTHEGHGAIIKSIRKISKKLGRHIALIADIQGPKMRVGILPSKGIVLTEGQIITLDCRKKEFSGDVIPLPSDMFMDGVKEGATVFFDDGLINLKITKKDKARFQAVVIKGGILFSNKGINVPSLTIANSLLSSKDISDIHFALGAGADYIALSFLRNGDDVRDAKKVLKGKKVKIIAKIERPEALLHIDEIIDEADAIMIARGDLGIETPLWELPIRQKEIVERVRKKMKPVIVATQMLDSMIRNPLPTRAEVSDVANAVYDSTDAVMLSGESASGKNPLEAVDMMRRVLESTETSQNYIKNGSKHTPSLLLSLASSATNIAAELNAKAIFVETLSGESIKRVSYFRPNNIIVAITNDEKTACQLALVWGVVPFILKSKSIKKVKDLIAPAVSALKDQKFLKKGDTVVCVYDERFTFSGKAEIDTITTKIIS